MANRQEPAVTADSWLASHHVTPGALVAVVVNPGIGLGLAVGDREPARFALATPEPTAVVDRLESRFSPRWVIWDRSTRLSLAGSMTAQVARCWDIVTVHRLLRGGMWNDPVAVWCAQRGLDPAAAPQMGQLGLLNQSEPGDAEDPVRPDGYLQPDWATSGYLASPQRMAKWASLALGLANEQLADITGRPNGDRLLMSAHVESAAEWLCGELATHGLPFDVQIASDIVATAVGPRPSSFADAERQRIERDEAVLALVPPGPPIDLRSPVDVKAMLRRIELDLPDTRAHRLREHRDHHPLVPALLAWRKAERLSNTYGYRWMDEHVDGARLRGDWTSSDGAAGRMTASAGLHNLPAELRPAVAAEPGCVFVRADLGQIEPRILAAVSGDDALIAATADDDMYQRVADRLGVERPIAKVAMLGAMYGSTTGESAHALRRLEREYPEAMQFLARAAAAGQRNESVHTIGGRPIHMWDADSGGDIERARRAAAARGRFARNAVIQGAAAEFFKMWAVTVRIRGRALSAEVVMCLHDELLVHVPVGNGAAAQQMVEAALAETAHRWSPDPRVRFVADTSVITRWSQAKD